MNEAERLFFEQMRQGVFEIDSEGRVWRVAEFPKGRGRNKIRRPVEPRRADYVAKSGYAQVTFHVEGKIRTVRAHRLVWLHFYGEIPEGQEVNHKHGIKTDNRPAELELMTHLENSRHAWETGLCTMGKGEDGPNAKLTAWQVAEIRRRYVPWVCTCKMLAQEFGVSMTTVYLVVTNKTWVHPEPILVQLPITIPMSETLEVS